MSRLADYDATTDIYELNCDNATLENALTNELKSTASDFEITLEPSLNLAPLIYLRSVEAEMNLQNLHVGGLPLSFSQTENVEVLLTFPNNAVSCNQEILEANLTTPEEGFNKKALKLQCSDYIAEEPKQAIAYINRLLQYRVNFFLLARYLTLFIDKKVLNDMSNGYLQTEDFKVLNFYANAAIYARHIQHKTLCQLANVQDDIKSRTDYLGNTKMIDAATETSVLDSSKCIIPKAERNVFTKTKTIDTTLFHGIDTRRDSEARRQLDEDIKTNILTILRAAKFNLAALAPKQKTEIEQMIASNKLLIEIGLICMKILKLEKERADRRTNANSRLFQTEFLFLDMDLSGQKCDFYFQRDGYIPIGATLTLFFPKKMSYTIGADSNKYAILGPITSAQTYSGPRLTNRIIFSSQKLPNAVRNLPNLLYLCCDLTSGKGQDSFLAGTPYAAYHIMYTFTFDDTTFKSRAIVANDCNSRFFKIKRVHKNVEKLSICLLDENFQLLLFAPRTFTRLSFQIRPANPI